MHKTKTGRWRLLPTARMKVVHASTRWRSEWSTPGCWRESVPRSTVADASCRKVRRSTNFQPVMPWQIKEGAPFCSEHQRTAGKNQSSQTIVGHDVTGSSPGTRGRLMSGHSAAEPVERRSRERPSFWRYRKIPERRLSTRSGKAMTLNTPERQRQPVNRGGGKTTAELILTGFSPSAFRGLLLGKNRTRLSTGPAGCS